MILDLNLKKEPERFLFLVPSLLVINVFMGIQSVFYLVFQKSPVFLYPSFVNSFKTRLRISIADRAFVYKAFLKQQKSQEENSGKQSFCAEIPKCTIYS